MKNYMTQPVADEVEIAGQSYCGTYTVNGGVVTARWNDWTDSTHVGAAGAELIAKSLVRCLIRQYKDAD